MPELPEVETTVRGLRSKVVGRRIKSVWLDWPTTVRGLSVRRFKQALTGRTITAVTRRGKWLIFHLSGQKTLLAHQKMTGHFLVGRWQKGRSGKKSPSAGRWQAVTAGPLRDDPRNDFIRCLIDFSDDSQLALSDLRRFARLRFIERPLPRLITGSVGVAELDQLGPEPFWPRLTARYLKEKLARRRLPIKQALLDQRLIAGLGNIYADEILWLIKIHPAVPANQLSGAKLEELIRAARQILGEAIAAGGTSRGDYRRPSGQPGGYQNKRRVYGREGQACCRCGNMIRRRKFAQRSAHYCPKCQKPN